MIGFHALHTTCDTLHSTAMLGPSHPDTNARCAVMMTRPYKPRDSARSALLTAVRNQRSGLALHPPEGYYTALRPLTGAANTRGAHEVVDTMLVDQIRLRVAPLKVPPPGWSGLAVPFFHHDGRPVSREDTAAAARRTRPLASATAVAITAATRHHHRPPARGSYILVQ